MKLHLQNTELSVNIRKRLKFVRQLTHIQIFIN